MIRRSIGKHEKIKTGSDEGGGGGEGETTLAKVLVSRAKKLSLMALASSAGVGLGRGDDLNKKDIGALRLDWHSLSSPQSEVAPEK